MTGTVESIEDQRVVLKDKDGASTTVQLAEGAKIQKQAEASLAELTAGTFIFATARRMAISTRRYSANFASTAGALKSRQTLISIAGCAL